MLIFYAKNSCRPGFLLAFFSTALALIVAALGVYSRFTDTGFDCSGWLDCDGGFSVMRENTLEVFKHYFSAGGWTEIMHQLLSAVLTLLVIWLAVNSWRLREDDSYPFRLPTFILFLVVWQSMLGMWSVDLVLWPQAALIHLLGGIVVCALLWLLALRLDGTYWVASKEIISRLDQIKPWITLAIIIVLIEIALGGWTSVKFAAFACSDFPSCQNAWWPEMNLQEGFNLVQPLGIEALESKARVAVNVVHRLGALIATVYLLGLSAFLLVVLDYRVQRMGCILAAVLFGQVIFVIGAGYVRDSAVSTIMHHLGSMLILLILISLASRVAHAKQK